MDDEAQLLFGGFGIVVAIAGLCGFQLTRGDSTSARRWWIALLPSGLAVMAWIVFAYDTQTNLLSDYGSDFPLSSTYGRYRAELPRSDLGFAASGWAYAALPALLGLAALDARRRRNGLFGSLLALACFAVAVPAFLPSALSREPSDELRFLAGDAFYEQLEPASVEVCFRPRTEGLDPSSEWELDGSELCLSLEPTFEARYLLHPGPFPSPLAGPPEPASTIDDVTQALSDQRLTPGEPVAPLYLRGIDVIDARWEQLDAPG